MPRRRQRNRYVEVYDQELAGRPLLYEGTPCVRCGLPLLGHHTFDKVGRWVHSDCDEPPDRRDVASHLLLHGMWDTGLDPQEIIDSGMYAASDAAVDEYLADWHRARAGSRYSGRRAGAASDRPSPASAPTLNQSTPQPRQRGTSASLPSVTDRSDILRVKRRIESAPPGRARVAVRVPLHVAVVLVRELGNLVSIGAMPVAQVGTLTLGVSQANRAAAVQRLDELLR